jgi:hypothetical protein
MKNNEVLAEEVCVFCLLVSCLDFNASDDMVSIIFYGIVIRLLSVMKELSSTLKILSGVG